MDELALPIGETLCAREDISQHYIVELLTRFDTNYNCFYQTDWMPFVLDIIYTKFDFMFYVTILH